MQWVTREHPRTDRTACPWLIRRFIDPEAEIVYVLRDEVLAYAQQEGPSPSTPPARGTPTATASAPSRTSWRTMASTTMVSSSWRWSSLRRRPRGHREHAGVGRPARDRRRLRAARPGRPTPARARTPGLRRSLRLGAAAGRITLKGRTTPGQGPSRWSTPRVLRVVGGVHAVPERCPPSSREGTPPAPR